MARKKKSNSGDELRGDEWLATFSDTITLLLTFFILLYSFSSVDQKKLKEISMALQSVLNGQSGTSILEFDMKPSDVPIVGEAPVENVGNIQPSDQGEAMIAMYNRVMEFVKNNKLEAVVTIKEDSRGIIIQLIDSILYESGSADIKENSKPILEKINNLISSFPNKIHIEGHTDNMPIKTFKFESNWELSTARAGSVVRYFIDVKAQPANRFIIGGYADTQPIVPNDTDAHKAMNRRVNILIVDNSKESTNK